MLADKLRAASLPARPLPTFVSSSTAAGGGVSTLTVTAPSNIQAGDLLVALFVQATTGTGVVTPPTGFNTIMRNTTFGGGKLSVSTKVASGESGNYVFANASSSGSAAAILVYRNASVVNAVGDVGGDRESNISIAGQITPTHSGELLAVFANSSSLTVLTPPLGMTQRALTTSSSGAGQSLGVYSQSSQGAFNTGNKVLAWSESGNSVATLLLQITNEPTVAPEFVASTQNASSGATLTINKPAGTVEGDLMIAVMDAAVAVSGGWSGDTGWIEVADQAGTSPALRIAYKTAGASEPSSYTFTTGTAGNKAGAILTYRYAAYDTIGTFTTGESTLSLPSISPSESQSVLLAVGGRAASVTLGTPTSMTSRASRAGTPSYIVCDQTVAKGPTGTRSMSTGSTTNVAGILFSIKPTRSL